MKSMPKPVRWSMILAVAVFAVGFASSASGVLVDMAGHWAAPLVAALEARGILSGDLSGRFEPDAPLSRAQMAKLMVMGLGNEADAQLLSRYDSRFRDIPAWHWAKGYIESLAESNVTEGYPDGAFGPADTVTRAQMAVFLVRAAGLAEQARLMRFESTIYYDDREIPDWARGSVHVALSQGLMSGFEDRTFRPLQPITRAEGGVTLLRLLGLKGGAFHLSGTLVRFDPVTGEGLVRDELGQERAFRMAPSAQYFRGSQGAGAQTVSPLDQVWIVLGPDGTGSFMDARYREILAADSRVDGQSLSVTLRDGNRRLFTVQTGALVFLNGRPAGLSEVDGAPEVYLALDSQSGEVRVLDGVNASVRGDLIAMNPADHTLVLSTSGEDKPFTIAPDAILLREGERINFTDLLPEDHIQAAVNQAGAIVYLQAER